MPSEIFLSRIKSTMILAWELARGSMLKLALFSLAFKVINFILLAPLVSFTMRLFLQRWGRVSVGNFEIAHFLLSPIGLVAICCVGGIAIATLYLEIAGLMQIMLNPRLRWWSFNSSYFNLYQKLLRLGGIQLSVVLATALPFVGLVGLIYAMLWQGRDLNGLIILRPKEFWWGVGLAAVVVAAFVALGLFIVLRWILALPILLSESKLSPRQSLRKSRESSRNNLSTMSACLIAWFLAQTFLATFVLAITHLALGEMLDVSWQTLSTAAFVTGVALTLEWLLGTTLSIMGNIGFAAVVLALYHIVAHEDIDVTRRRIFVEALVLERSSAVETNEKLASFRLGWLLALTSVVMVGIAIGVSYWICDTLVLRDRIQITAHRAGAAVAPENTIAAIQRAIADKSDWAEIDVQLTADKELVVMHDTDLARVGGGSKAVGNTTMAEIQSLDVGSLFSKDFVGARIPRFSDLLMVSKDQIRLNVELKPHGTSDTDALTRQVVDAIRQSGMTSQCRICSQSYACIQLAKKIEPEIEIGFIVATSLGDSTKLDVNFLMLSHTKITRQVVDRASTRGIEIHAWTVNDPNLVLKLIDAGVRNIITDDTLQIREQLKVIETLRPIERLLLRAKNGMN
jgi:glycerophosphoryl diester phosphodiesterase